MSVELDQISKLVNELIKMGFEEAAAKATLSNVVMTKIANSSVSVVQNWRRVTVDLYLAKERRIFVLRFEPKSFEELYKPVESILSMSRTVEESPIYAPLPEPSKIKYVEEVYDKSIVSGMEDIGRLAERVIEVAHRERIDSVAGMLQIGEAKTVLATSKGALLEERKTFLQSYLRAFAEPDGSGQWCFTSTSLDVKGLESMAFTASRYAVDSRNRSDIEPGVYDIILSPMVFGNLLEYIVSMATGFAVIMGWSMFMKNKPGDRVASEHLTVLDEPRNRELPNFRSFDDEALETFNKPIIENGVLKTLLHNTKTAKALNASSTANAGWISPEPWNIVVKPGNTSLDEMISEVRRGILITNNWYTRLQNYVEGIFSTVARDAIFYIENGRIVKPVSKLRIADKFTNILNNIEMIEKSLYNIQWWEVSTPSKIPYVLIRNINTSKHVI
ncbi:TldD/PmbA family protein [Ignisphaera sp. 4213-co]|uniref:TldD/PmbA family protein n=1 Tax=Ignisphaera cupida TaxID=3050454 RepID=A0ABD4Z7K1_9CREN|nr:TldD/PmbA family protein [Ignisphaera sp. 4213-co]MDK6029219.1 TldD/PmbA family protein [Ignisphaera sp. 4213-co]